MNFITPIPNVVSVNLGKEKIVLNLFRVSAIWMSEAIEMTADSYIVRKHWQMEMNAAIFISQKFNPIKPKIPSGSIIET